VLVTLTPRIYREAIAFSLGRSRPGSEVEGTVGLDPDLSTAIGAPRTRPGPRPRGGPFFPR